MRAFACALGAIAMSSVCSSPIGSQPALTSGAAEIAGKGWPYPEPAQRGATGYSPDYAAFQAADERWDIYIHILWRKAGSTVKSDLEYYDYELTQFMDSMSAEDRAKFKAASHLLLIVEQVRANVLQLPYRDDKTGCLLFEVRHDRRLDLEANDCRP